MWAIKKHERGVALYTPAEVQQEYEYQITHRPWPTPPTFEAWMKINADFSYYSTEEQARAIISLHKRGLVW